MSEAPDDKTPKGPIGEEEVMRMVDGELPADQHAAVMDALAADPDLMELYKASLFSVGPLVDVIREEVPDLVPEKLLRVVRETPSPQPRMAPQCGRGGLLAGFLDMLRMPAFSPAVAIPAMLVAAAGGWLVHYAASPASPDASGLIETAALQRALEVTPTNVSAGIDRGLTLTPKITFVTQQKIWCRQYSLADGSGLEAGGVACRNGDGVWQVLMQTRAAPAPRERNPKGYSPAGDKPVDNALPSNASLLDGVREQVKGGDPILNREAVEQAIGERWRPKQ